MLETARRYVARRQAELAASAKRFKIPRAGTAADIRDRGPAALGRLVVETREVAPDGTPAGEWQKKVDDSNLVVRQAESIMAQMAIGAASSALAYVELGDPTFPANPPTLADLGLQQSTAIRKAMTVTAAGNVVTGVVTFLVGEGNGNTYTEAGFFNGTLGAGLMFARKVFAGITKTISFEMRFTWYITFLVNTTGGDCSGIALIGPSSVSSYTYYDSTAVGVGGQVSVAATFDFAVGANNVDVFLRGQRLVPGTHYQESASLTATVLGPAINKGINLSGFALIPGDEIFLIQRTLS